MSEGRAESGEDPRSPAAGERTLLACWPGNDGIWVCGRPVRRFSSRSGADQANVLPASSDRHSTLALPWSSLAAVNLLAALEHFLFIRRIDRGQAYRPPRWIVRDRSFGHSRLVRYLPDSVPRFLLP